MNPRWGAYAPLPFVGATALLLVLIVLTPSLISLGEPAPGILTQAEFGVDRAPVAALLHFYIRPLGATVRYAGIWIGVDENASDFNNWTGSGSIDWARLRYDRFLNGTDVVLLGFNTTANPVAVNVTACYASANGDELYQGELAFYTTTGLSASDRLYAATDTAGVTVPSSTQVGDLPYWIPLSSTATTCGGP